MTERVVYAEIRGPIVMVGFGSVGQGILPLLERHFVFDRAKMVVIDPDDSGRHLLDERGIRFVQSRITAGNYRAVLGEFLSHEGDVEAFCINAAVEVSSMALVGLCREYGVLYIDTVLEPWSGFYLDAQRGSAARTNYVLREEMLAEKRTRSDGVTALLCCGANPGMVSWFVKRALMNLTVDMGMDVRAPETQHEWARLMQSAGVKGIHIAERDTQCAQRRRPYQSFWNTWSVNGFVAEAMQPAELGWGTHEKWMPESARRHKSGCQCGIYLNQPGAQTWVRTWCPTLGPQHGMLVTHNESLSIAHYFTVQNRDEVVYRPTCHYAYHPCDDALLSMHELFGRGGNIQSESHVLEPCEIVSGQDELGVLLYGHGKNAYWYGSQLSIEQTRDLVPYQNATVLQVTSAILAGMVWMLENPRAGLVEADEVDYGRCLQVQSPYLGIVKGYYTDWTPLEHRFDLFGDSVDRSDPWQFRNILVQTP